MSHITHIPFNVGANPSGISFAMQRHGLDSSVWILSDNYFNFPFDHLISKSTDNKLQREIHKLLALRYVFKTTHVFFNYGTGLFVPFLPVDFSKGAIYLLISLVYSLYSSLFSFVEIFLLLITNTKISIQYQGDDARQSSNLSPLLYRYFPDVATKYYSPLSDFSKSVRIFYYSLFCNNIFYLNPDLYHFLPSRSTFLPYSHIAISDWDICSPSFTRPLRIGHAPSNRRIKGTEFVLSAFSQLAKDGFCFEPVLIEGLSHSDAISQYKTLDILVDQLLIGWYGALSVELLSLGKIVIANIDVQDPSPTISELITDLPILHATPDSLYSVLKSLINTDPTTLHRLSLASRAFVEKWHDPDKIYSSFLARYFT